VKRRHSIAVEKQVAISVLFKRFFMSFFERDSSSTWPELIVDVCSSSFNDCISSFTW